MSGWRLDPRLEAESHAVADLQLCSLRLFDDARWPWLLLVPRVTGARELVDLDAGTQSILLAEIDRGCRLLQSLYRCDKLNVAALGNLVEQLHVHLVARRHDDPAWPRPVWGVGERQPWSAAARATEIARLREALAA